MPDTVQQPSTEATLQALLAAIGGSLTIAPTLSTSFVTGADVVVASAGTAVQCNSLAASFKGIQIAADPSNTGTIYCGDSSVTRGTGAKRGTPLVPGGTAFFAVSNANKIWINADNNNDKAGVNAL